MADGSNIESERPRVVTAQIVVTELVPDGRAMAAVELKDRTVLAIHPKHISAQLGEELAHHFDYAQQVGLFEARTGVDGGRSHPHG